MWIVAISTQFSRIGDFFVLGGMKIDHMVLKRYPQDED